MSPSLKSNIGFTLIIVTFIATACTRAVVDPTESNTVLTLKNDLGSQATLRACEDMQCRKLAGSVSNSIAPGDILKVNVSSEGVPSYYRVVTASTAGARCLVLNSSSQKNLIPLSAAVSCSYVQRSQSDQSQIGIIAGWAIFLLIAVTGIAISAIASIQLYRYLRDRGVNHVVILMVVAIATVMVFLGLWTVVLVYWLLRGAIQISRRMLTVG